MRRPRRNHSSEFKAKVALAAIQGDLTMSELVKKFDVHANQVTEWKKQLPLSGAPDVFGKGAQKAEGAEQAVSELHAKIGQLTRACPSETNALAAAIALGLTCDWRLDLDRSGAPALRRSGGPAVRRSGAPVFSLRS
jgi:transposase